MKELIFHRNPSPKEQTNAQSSKYQQLLYISYGKVKSNNNDGTCNVLLNKGIETRVRIPSTTWANEEPVTGGISYPPVGAQVMIFAPENDLNSGYIYPSNLNLRNSEVEDELLDQGDITKLPGGWTHTYDQETGKTEFTHGSSFDLIVDPDSNLVSLTDFEGNTFKNNGAVWEINGNGNFAVGYDKLKIEFDELNSKYNKLITTLLAWVPVPSDGGASLKVGLVAAAPLNSVANINNAKVSNVKLA